MTYFADHFAGHLRELRQRIIISFAFLTLSGLVAYIFAGPISEFLMRPLFFSQPVLARLVYTNLTEAFVCYLKISLLVGIVISFPIFLYEAWMFVSPGLHEWEKKTGLLVVFWATLLFAGGVAFAYFIVMPKLLAFFMSFAGPDLEPLPRLDSYLTFVVRTSLAFGLAFEIPFLMVVASRTGLVKNNYFIGRRKYFYPLIVVLAFLLATGDPLSTFLLAVPLFGLYEAGIIIIKIWG